MIPNQNRLCLSYLICDNEEIHDGEISMKLKTLMFAAIFALAVSMPAWSESANPVNNQTKAAPKKETKAEAKAKKDAAKAKKKADQDAKKQASQKKK